MRDRLGQYRRSTFSSLSIRNYRLYYIGQVISNSGTWMQSVAQAWLVLQLTHSGTALGFVAALQFLPILVLGPFGGVIADRFPKRKLMVVTQSAFGLQAFVLGMLVATGIVQLWMVEVLAFSYGLINAVDNPVRQSFVIEMVGPRELRNAVTLFSTLVNLSRVVGPTLAGILITAVGLAPCFIINGISYLAVIIMLLMMQAAELFPAPPIPVARGQLRAGLRYVLATPILRNVLLMLAIIGTLTFEFSVSLPLIAQFTFNGGADSYAALSAAMGIGAVAGGLMTAGQKKTSPRMLVVAAFLFGLATTLAALMPSLALTAVAMIAVGLCSIYFTTLGNSILQLESEPQMRGRVMAFWAMAFLGSTTIGGPIIGWVGQNIGPRWGLAVGGIAAIVAAGLGALTVRQVQPPKRVPEAVVSAAESAADRDLRVP